MRHKFTIILLAVIAGLTGNLVSSCEDFTEGDHKFANSVYLDVSATNPVQQANFNRKIDVLEKNVILTLTYPEDKDVTATLSMDESLVVSYNTKHGTDYKVLPEEYRDFTSATVTIEAGRTTSAAVPVKLKNLLNLTIDETFLLPVRISEASIDAMEDGSVAYYLFKRSSAITTAARLTDNWINFPTLDVAGAQSDAFNGLSAVTYEALIYIDKFDLENYFGACNISSVMGVEQYLLMRIGDTNFERQQIQFDGSGVGFGKFPATSTEKKLYAGQWYHVACTYDMATATARVYVNGRIQSESTEAAGSGVINLAQRALGSAEAYQFFLAKSYNDYRPLQGMMAEARVWSVARTPEEIWENMYRIADPKDHPELIGYWKFDEGEGNTIKDYSLYGNDGVAETDVIWPEGIEIEEINKEEE